MKLGSELMGQAPQRLKGNSSFKTHNDPTLFEKIFSLWKIVLILFLDFVNCSCTDYQKKIIQKLSFMGDDLDFDFFGAFVF